MKITPNLYMDKYEVTNGDWKAFEKHLIDEGENPAEYRTNDVWEYMGDAFEKQYYAEFSNYPVAGVTYEGAQKYCIWKGSRSRKKGTFRLPTIDEIHHQIAEGEQGRKWRQTEKWAKKTQSKMCNLSESGRTCIAPNNSHAVNKFGIYNIKGNMAEMTTTKGSAVGGSYMDKGDKDWTTYIQTYDAPTAWLGFRCVCELTN